MNISCPKCHKNLVKSGNSLKCLNNHTYDIAKEGYVNLILNHHASSGDDNIMITARNHFLTGGYYKALVDKIDEILNVYQPKTIADIGCGEGYYTNYLSGKHCDSEFFGIDLSKFALKKAAKNSNVKYIVSSAHALPFSDQSIEGCLSIFAPFSFIEIERVLAKNGIFIVVSPLEKHLWEMKEILYDDLKINETRYENTEFTLVDEVHLKDVIKLTDSNTIMDLFMMTPYYYTSSLSAKTKLSKIKELSLSIEFLIRIYRNVKQRKD